MIEKLKIFESKNEEPLDQNESKTDESESKNDDSVDQNEVKVFPLLTIIEEFYLLVLIFLVIFILSLHTLLF